jgi:gas vesicle protein
MNNFLKGALFGVGIGLLVAPMRGEEMRRLLAQRAQELSGYLPENEQMSQYTSQVSDRVSQTAGVLKDYAQQAATTVKSTANNLSSVAQTAASNVKQTSQDFTQQTKNVLKQGSQDLNQQTKDAATTTQQNAQDVVMPRGKPSRRQRVSKTTRCRLQRTILRTSSNGSSAKKSTVFYTSDKRGCAHLHILFLSPKIVINLIALVFSFFCILRYHYKETEYVLLAEKTFRDK